MITQERLGGAGSYITVYLSLPFGYDSATATAYIIQIRALRAATLLAKVRSTSRHNGRQNLNRQLEKRNGTSQEAYVLGARERSEM